MAQIFSPAADAWLRLALVTAAGAVLFGLAVVLGFVHSGWATRQDQVVVQPVPFSHKHHVGGLGLDCRYCHTDVEQTASAGFPPTHICMTCHSQIWTNAGMLARVRESFATGRAIRWNRVHLLPDYVYFDHSIHVAKGIGCTTCHGAVDEMPLTRQAAPLTMEWCIACHRHPEPNLRARDQVFSLDWQPAADQEAVGRKRIVEYGIAVDRLDNCYTCHR
jgi:hypothetical protein